MNYALACIVAASILFPSRVHSTEVPPKPALNPALHVPCACESTGSAMGTPTQYDPNGNVLHGRINHDDIGECQINNDYNGAQASAMGFDIYTEDGNIQFANYLYETQGLRPWKWSEHCWGQTAEGS